MIGIHRITHHAVISAASRLAHRHRLFLLLSSIAMHAKLPSRTEILLLLLSSILLQKSENELHLLAWIVVLCSVPLGPDKRAGAGRCNPSIAMRVSLVSFETSPPSILCFFFLPTVLSYSTLLFALPPQIIDEMPPRLDNHHHHIAPCLNSIHSIGAKPNLSDRL